MAGTTNRQLMQAMGEVARTAQLQRRHLLLWLVILGVMVGAGLLIRNAPSILTSPPSVLADLSQDISEGEADLYGQGLTIDINVDARGLATVNGKSAHKIFQPLSSFDELKYQVLDKPDTFLSQVTVQVTFDQPIPEGTKLISYAVHGVDESSEEQIDEYTIEYTAVGIGPEATYTVVAQLPKGSIDWPADRLLIGTIMNLPIGFWLAISTALPALTSIVLLVMFWPALKSLLRRPTLAMRSQPPKDLPPALIGILVHGRISAREIAATLIDLANRGYLTIYNRGNGSFSFAKRRPWQGLRSFELLLLTQLFSAKSYKSTAQDIELSIGSRLFSPEIARVYLSMYDLATQAGYFRANPGAIHQRYRFIGLSLFFLGLVAFVLALLLEIQPTFILLLLVGMMTMALIIIVAADSVPLLTPAGEQAREEWLAFQHYLGSNVPLGYIEGSQAFYQRFLPYAIVLGQEIDWANRFREHPFERPDWYDATENNRSIEDFARGLYVIVSSIAHMFSAAKEPTVQ